MTSSIGWPVGDGLVHAGEELADLEAVRPDAVDRADRAVQDVVPAPELPRPLDGEDVERLLHHAHPAVVAAGIAADRAERRVADVEAAVAEDDLVADGDQRAGERAGLRVGGAQEVVGEPLRRLGADPGQARERLDQARDGLDDGAGHGRTVSRGRGCAGRR